MWDRRKCNRETALGGRGQKVLTFRRAVRDDRSEKLGKSEGYLWEGVQGGKLVSAKAGAGHPRC